MNVSLRRIVAACLMAAVVSLAAAPFAAAEQKKVEINTAHSIKQILESFSGQRVIVKTDAGESLEGTVTSVGDHIVHISKLSGKDYYDAVVVIARISSVTFRAR